MNNSIFSWKENMLIIEVRSIFKNTTSDIRLITSFPSSILNAYIDQRIKDPIILNPKFIKTMNTQFLPNTTHTIIPAWLPWPTLNALCHSWPSFLVLFTAATRPQWLLVWISCQRPAARYLTQRQTVTFTF